jgi:hypothetical protein
MHKEAYISRFEDEYGNVQEKELPRPAVAHFLYEFLPLIDEHNKARQSALALEKKWLTKNPWTRILTTFLGMAVVDLQRWDRKMRQAYAANQADVETGYCLSDDEAVVVDDFDIRGLANLISRALRDSTYAYRQGPQPSMRLTSAVQPQESPIERITSRDGRQNYAPSGGKQTGKNRQMTCFICRRYTNKGINTTWRCVRCKMPICQKPRNDPSSGRHLDCIEEHKQSTNRVLGCGFIPGRDTFIMTSDLRAVTSLTRGQKRKQDEINEQRRLKRRAPPLPPPVDMPRATAAAGLPEPTPLRRKSPRLNNDCGPVVGI